MEISPAMLSSLLIASGVLVALTLAGLFIERLLISRLRRRTTAAEENPDQWRMWRGLGWLTGAWVGFGIDLQDGLVSADWHNYAMLGWKIAGVAIGTVYTARVLGRVVQDNTRMVASSLPSVSLLKYVVKVTVYVLGALIILQLVDISITPILTALGVGGLAVALALQDTLSNLFAGIQIIASRKLLPGHYIILEGGEEGYITDIAWRTTTIQTVREAVVIVPNKTIANSIITNTWLPDKSMPFDFEGEVHYKSDLEKVEKIVLETALALQKGHKSAVKKHIPTVRFYSFSNSGVRFRVTLKAMEYDLKNELRHDMIKTLHQRFQEEGIRIPYPTQTVLLEGNGADGIKE